MAARSPTLPDSHSHLAESHPEKRRQQPHRTAASCRHCGPHREFLTRHQIVAHQLALGKSATRMEHETPAPPRDARGHASPLPGFTLRSFTLFDFALHRFISSRTRITTPCFLPRTRPTMSGSVGPSAPPSAGSPRPFRPGSFRRGPGCTHMTPEIIPKNIAGNRHARLLTPTLRTSPETSGSAQDSRHLLASQNSEYRAHGLDSLHLTKLTFTCSRLHASPHHTSPLHRLTVHGPRSTHHHSHFTAS